MNPESKYLLQLKKRINLCHFKKNIKIGFVFWCFFLYGIYWFFFYFFFSCRAYFDGWFHWDVMETAPNFQVNCQKYPSISSHTPLLSKKFAKFWTNSKFKFRQKNKNNIKSFRLFSWKCLLNALIKKKVSWRIGRKKWSTQKELQDFFVVSSLDVLLLRLTSLNNRINTLYLYAN